MPGSYYYSTPIGAGMSNLAQAIAGGPAREAQAGLLAARQQLLNAQIATQGGELGAHNAQAREHNAVAHLREGEYAGRTGMGDVIANMVSPSTMGMGAPSAAGLPVTAPSGDFTNAASLVHGFDTPTPSVADALTSSALPLGHVPGVGAVPGALPTAATQGSVANAVGATPNFAMSPAGVTSLPAPQPAAAVPGTASAIVPGGGTGITPEFMHAFGRAAAMTGMKPQDLLNMVVGGNLAAQETTPDAAQSRVQSGAGDAFDHTVRGGLATIGERATAASAETARKTANDRQESADRLAIAQGLLGERTRYDTGRLTNDAGRVAAKGAPRGAKAQLPANEEKRIRDDIDNEASAQGLPALTPAQSNAVFSQIREAWRGGDDPITATASALDSLSVPDQPAVHNMILPDKKATRKFNADAFSVGSPSSGTGGVPTSPGKAPAPVPRDKTTWVPGTDYTLASGRTATWTGTGWVPK